MANNVNHEVEVEVQDPLEADDELIQPMRYTIATYGVDFPVDGLVSRLDRKDVFIPHFQRKFVWSVAQSSRFIESHLLGLPVPSIFLFREPETKKLMVVDGQQRLLTLQHFYKGYFNTNKKPFKLIGVSEEFNGMTYDDLMPDLQRYLNDSIVHATVFHQLEPGNDQSSVYSVFERLNTGATPLSAQEIRSCLYRGKFINLLGKMSKNVHWRSLYGAKDPRKKGEEIILRFLALYNNQENYRRPMKIFLNGFLEEHCKATKKTIDQFYSVFQQTVKTVDTILTPQALRPERALNVSVADAVLVGLAHRLRGGPVHDPEALKKAHEGLIKKLRDNDLFTTGTTNEDRVNLRINYARQAYENVR